MKNHFSQALRTLLPTFASYYDRSGARRQAGFTLLLAALVASIVLALGTSIFAIAKKQVTLSTLGRDSQFAFYTADTGAECALYWDVRFNAFSTASTAVNPSCDGRPITIAGASASLPYSIEFQVNLFVDGDGVTGTADDGGYCADVTVTKNATNPHTVIHADGYSVSCEAKNGSTRALQRSVELQY